MDINPRTLAIANYIIQMLLLVTVITGTYIARKHQYKIHCGIIRVAAGLQIILSLTIMLPSMLTYLHSGDRGPLFTLEMLIHHSLGVIVILFWIYFNMVVLNVIKIKGRLITPMRTALALWIISILIGSHLFFTTWF
jgi:hypothetical protein